MTYKNTMDTSENFDIIEQSEEKPDNIPDISFTVDPNPSKGIFTVTLQSKLEHAGIIVRNILGKVMLYQEPKQDKATIDMSNAPKGPYFVQVVQGEFSVHQKIIIQE